MAELAREARLLRTFAILADTLVDDYDVVDLLQLLVDTCAETLDIAAAGISLVDSHGELEVIVSTSEASRLVELIQLTSDAGPGVASFHSGEIVSVASIADSTEAWPRFSMSALEQGFKSALAVPLRLRDTRIGTLNLLGAAEGALGEEDVLVSQALADVATIGILQHRAISTSAELAGQLQNALNSRVVIEQAKGVISHLHGVSVDESFALLRGYSRSHNMGIAEVAAGVVDQRIVVPGPGVDPLP